MFGILDGSKLSSDSARKKISLGLSALNHRGPDGVGQWLDSSCNAALGHTRLSIIDVEGGAQPVTSQDGSIIAVVNGEFYEHGKIRSEMKARGHKFKTQSDSEILIALYQNHGTDCLQYLRGEFAFVLYDKNRHEIFAARDRFGIKPLFYGTHLGIMYFGSEIKSLLAAGIPAEWDIESYISRSFSFGDRTLFKGVRSLPPGSYCLARKNDVKIHRYWDLNYPCQDIPRTQESQNSVVEHVRESLEKAVMLRMDANVPIAYYLSGGIDSSAILAIASRLAGMPLPAFTIAFEGAEDYDEEIYARQAAKHVRANHNLVKVTSKMLADNFDAAILHNEYPFFNAHGIGKMILSKAVSNAGYKVAMTGEGADEMFAGYPHFRRDMRRAGAGCSSHTKHVTYTDGIVCPTFLENSLGCSVSWLENQNGMIAKIFSVINKDLMLENYLHSPVKTFIDSIDVGEKIAKRHPMHVAMYLWAKSFLPNFVLTTLGDRMEMANSVEGRTPFLDHCLAELSFNVPVGLKINGESEKYILREALKSYLPDSIRLRKKHYFRAPPALDVSNAAMREKIFDTLSSTSAGTLPFFGKKALHSLLDTARNSSSDEQLLLDPILTEIASLCVMQEQFSLGG